MAAKWRPHQRMEREGYRVGRRRPRPHPRLRLPRGVNAASIILSRAAAANILVGAADSRRRPLFRAKPLDRVPQLPRRSGGVGRRRDPVPYLLQLSLVIPPQPTRPGALRCVEEGSGDLRLWCGVIFKTTIKLRNQAADYIGSSIGGAADVFQYFRGRLSVEYFRELLGVQLRRVGRYFRKIGPRFRRSLIRDIRRLFKRRDSLQCLIAPKSRRYRFLDQEF